MAVGRACFVVAAAWLVGSGGCSRDEVSVGPDRGADNPGARSSKPALPVELVAVAGDSQDAAAVVKRELERARADRRELLVYVGAPWCEPCTRFHQAAAAGELDSTFPGLRLLEFDHDRDVDRLEAAGYKSRLIPLFAVPGPDGRASGKQIEGSIKGEGAVREISPRLRALLSAG